MQNSSFASTCGAVQGDTVVSRAQVLELQARQKTALFAARRAAKPWMVLALPC
jgi:hypothetical protein